MSLYLFRKNDKYLIADKSSATILKKTIFLNNIKDDESSIKYIDKILFNNKKRQDIAAEGYSFRSEERQVTEDVDDVIEILKTKWTK
jgi:hypothetical protein